MGATSSQEASPTAGYVVVSLSLSVPGAPPGAAFAITGDGPLFGAWAADAIVRMRKDSMSWTRAVLLPERHAPVEFAFAIVTAAGAVHVEQGPKRTLSWPLPGGRLPPAVFDLTAAPMVPAPSEAPAGPSAPAVEVRAAVGIVAERASHVELAEKWMVPGVDNTDYWAKQRKPSLPQLSQMPLATMDRPMAGVATGGAPSPNAVVPGRPPLPPGSSQDLAAPFPPTGAFASHARRSSGAVGLEMADAADPDSVHRRSFSWDPPGGIAPKSAGVEVDFAAGTPTPKSDKRRFCIILVGLPARGKTFTAQKLTRYLRWLGHDTRHFNVGKYRRRFHGRNQTAAFFDPENEEGVAARWECAKLCMEDLLAWMDDGGQVGIYDATNSTVERRLRLLDLCRSRCKVIFLETICTDYKLIEDNVRLKVSNSPDYENTADKEQATADFMTRLRNYEKSYEPVGDAEAEADPQCDARDLNQADVGGPPPRVGSAAAAEPPKTPVRLLRTGSGATIESPSSRHRTTSYIKLIDMASGAGKVQVNAIQGYLPGRIVFFLLNTHVKLRPIYFTRHGQSMDNTSGSIGGDSSISDAGKAYSHALKAWVDALPEQDKPFSVWTSTLQRTIQTARPLVNYPKVHWRALDEIDAGICEGMTYDEIKVKMPEEYAGRKADKLGYRYPRGESYLDVIQRVEPVIIELERQRQPVMVVAHRAILRALLAYFTDKQPQEIPYTDVPLHTVIKLTPSTYSDDEERFVLAPVPSNNAD